MLLDNSVSVTVCSFHNTLTPTDRNDVLYNIVKECRLSIAETMKLLQHGFTTNFQHAKERQEMSEKAWNESIQFLTNKGFQYFHKRTYFKN